MTAVASSKTHISPAMATLAGGQVRVFNKARAVKKVVVGRAQPPKISEQTRRTFEMISDPKHAHLFTVDAALQAFAHVKV